MSQSQTAVPVVSAATQPPPCPSWCNPELHDLDETYLVHWSDPVIWEEGDLPTVEVALRRGDELRAPFPDNIGQTDIDVDVGGCPVYVSEKNGWPVLGGI